MREEVSRREQGERLLPPKRQPDIAVECGNTNARYA